MRRRPQAARAQLFFLSQVVSEALFTACDHPRVSAEHKVSFVASDVTQLLMYQVHAKWD